MDTLIYTNRVDFQWIPTFLEQIQQTCMNDGQLAYRSMRELQKAYDAGNLLMVTAGTRLVGWILRIRYTPHLQELAAGFVLPEYRDRGVFEQLLERNLKLCDRSLIVTFSPRLASYLQNKMHFRQSTLWEMVRLSFGLFLLHRMNLGRIKSIQNHLRTATPIYTLYTNGQ